MLIEKRSHQHAVAVLHCSSVRVKQALSLQKEGERLSQTELYVTIRHAAVLKH